MYTVAKIAKTVGVFVLVLVREHPAKWWICLTLLIITHIVDAIIANSGVVAAILIPLSLIVTTMEGNPTLVRAILCVLLTTEILVYMYVVLEDIKAALKG